MNVVTLDIESAWDSKEYTLSKMGAIEYSRDPRFHCQMVGLAVNGTPPVVHADTGNDEVRAALASLDAQHDMFCAHNGAGFDFVALHENFGFSPRWMIDTIYMMRWCGLSRISAESHAALTELLGNGHKEAGTVVSDGKTWPQDFSAQEQVFFKQYCADDVAQCQRNMMAMMPYMTNDVLRFMALTARMATEPVFVLDEAMLDEYIRQLDAEAEDARRRIMEIFHFATLDEFFKAIRSADKFAAMLRHLGVEPPTKVSEKKTATMIAKLEAQVALPGSDQAALQRQLAEVREQGVHTYAFSKSDLDFLELREHDDPRVRMLVETRLEFNSSILRSRAETLLKFARHRKPLPIMLSAFKAHTGRYSAGTSEGKSDGTQVQNLSKRNPAHLVLRKAIQAPRGYKIVACDSSQIELRVNAWMAQQHDLLAHLRAGRDPYAELAARFASQYTAQQIHDGAKSGDKDCKKLRNVAKQLLLACVWGKALVFTPTGAKRLSDITLDDKIWDGEEYVSHGGLACRGEKEVIRIGHTLMTPDHLIWTGTAWKAAECMELPDFCLAIDAGRDALPAGCNPYKIIPADERLLLYSEAAQREPTVVYDIVECGPRNRFLIFDGEWAFLVHNCGYGTSAKKFAMTLLRQGMHLANDREEHNAIAEQYHMIYRTTNYSIVNFWKRCNQVLKAMIAGYSGKFGGPNDDTFEYGMMRLGPLEREVASVKMPSGYILRYPNLRYNAEGEIVYDFKLGKNIVPRRMHGAKLDENCIAEGTKVYTDSGWKPIENIRLSDKIYDGVDFVPHQGLVYRGVQGCIELDGVRLTPDHRVLTLEGWCESESAQLERLHRCTLRAAPRRRHIESPIQGRDWAALRDVDSCKTHSGNRGESRETPTMEVGFSLRLRRLCGAIYSQCCDERKKGPHASLPSLYGKQCKAQAFQAWRHREQIIPCVAWHAESLSKSWSICVSAIRRARDFCVRALDGLPQFCRRYGRRLLRGFSFRPYRYERQLLQGELSLDFVSCKRPQQGWNLSRYRCGGVFQGDWDREVDYSIPDRPRVAAGTTRFSPLGIQCEVESVSSQREIQARVYDIINCGPRHRFVVQGISGPVIVSNCCQSLAFQALQYQACRMDEAGIQLKCNIHDSWATVVPDVQVEETAERMLWHMRQVPPWMAGCPLDAEVETGTDFTVV